MAKQLFEKKWPGIIIVHSIRETRVQYFPPISYITVYIIEPLLESTCTSVDLHKTNLTLESWASLNIKSLDFVSSASA